MNSQHNSFLEKRRTQGAIVLFLLCPIGFLIYLYCLADEGWLPLYHWENWITLSLFVLTWSLFVVNEHVLSAPLAMFARHLTRLFLATSAGVTVAFCCALYLASVILKSPVFAPIEIILEVVSIASAIILGLQVWALYRRLETSARKSLVFAALTLAVSTFFWLLHIYKK